MQIRDQLVEAIACGELVAGDGLPSVRRLASDLGINLHTVNKAYALLRDEGYLVMRGRSGAFVADVERAASRERREITELHLADDLRKLAFEYKARGGGEEAFVELAAEAARRAYGDPGVAGARRAVGVLGVDEAGCRLKAADEARLLTDEGTASSSRALRDAVFGASLEERGA